MRDLPLRPKQHYADVEASSDQEFDFCRELRDMVSSREIVGRTGKTFKDLAALSTRNNLIVLRNLCLQFRAALTLEIGLGFGASCLTIAATHRDLKRDPHRQHIAIDPYQKAVWDDCGLNAVERAGLSDYLDFRENKSCQTLAELFAQGKQVDLTYIDGSHLIEDVFVDFYFASRLISEGGIVLFDDSSNKHVLKVLRFIRTNLKESFIPFDLRSYRSDKGRPMKYRLAHCLGFVQLQAFQKVGPVERRWDAAFNDF